MTKCECASTPMVPHVIKFVAVVIVFFMTSVFFHNICFMKMTLYILHFIGFMDHSNLRLSTKIFLSVIGPDIVKILFLYGGHFELSW